MQPISVNLRPESFKRFNRYFAPSAIIFGIVTIIVAIGSWEHAAWINAATGTLIIVQAVVNWRSNRPLVSTWDDAGIHGRVNPGMKSQFFGRTLAGSKRAHSC